MVKLCFQEVVFLGTGQTHHFTRGCMLALYAVEMLFAMRDSQDVSFALLCDQWCEIISARVF
jgi:hypothetical protein